MPSAHLGPESMNFIMDFLEEDSLLEILVIVILICSLSGRKRKRLTEKAYSMIERIPHQVKHLTRLVGVTNADCIANLRMYRNTFGRLVLLLRQVGGLVDGKSVSVEEQVATFLGILAHHKKNRVVRFDYWRSGQTVSRYVHVVLKSILMLHGILLVKPEPVPNDCTDFRWKWFKGCLGALDGTYINVKVANSDKPFNDASRTSSSSAVQDRFLFSVLFFLENSLLPSKTNKKENLK